MLKTIATLSPELAHFIDRLNLPLKSDRENPWLMPPKQPESSISCMDQLA